MKKFAFYLLAGCFIACSSQNKQQDQQTPRMPEATYEHFKAVMSSVQEVERLIDGKEQLSMSAEQVIQLYDLTQDLRFDYDPLEMDSSSQAACHQLSERANSLRQHLQVFVNDAVKNMEMSVFTNSDFLLESTFVVPAYLEHGDSLIVDIRTEHPSVVNILNADSRTTLKTFSGKTDYHYTQKVRNTAIYLVEINPGAKAQYGDIAIRYFGGSIDRIRNPRSVDAAQIEANKGDWRATAVKGIEMRNLFTEPRKFTLRGQIKAAFSGSSRALVALQVPAGASDVLYSLRIATNETDRSQDGEFYDNMNVSYNRIRFLGLPLYDRHSGSGLISTLLGDNQPLREEDAYINMYVFYNAQQAKKFQDGTPAAELKYSVDYSTLGTQSISGRIPSQGYKTIYLGFENERMRFNNYVWLEAISAVPHTEYYKTKYSLAD